MADNEIMTAKGGTTVAEGIKGAGTRAFADDEEEMVASTAVRGDQSTEHYPASDRPNAFTEMMKPRKGKEDAGDAPADQGGVRTVFAGRDGLAAYTTDPVPFPPSRVVYHNDNFVVINDLYPKASVHLLILPRDTSKNVLAPQDAFDDANFLALCREEEKKVRAIVASELRRRFGRLSASDKSVFNMLDYDDGISATDLPSGRDWSKEVISGIHANPSMNHLHIHVLSRDMMSECMKKTNHYLSFTTDFFVPLEEFPLAPDDYRRRYGRFPGDMKCWRCGKDFGNRIGKLKEHLDHEFDAWKRE